MRLRKTNFTFKFLFSGPLFLELQKFGLMVKAKNWENVELHFKVFLLKILERGDVPQDWRQLNSSKKLSIRLKLF